MTELGHEYAADRLDSIGLTPACADDLAVALTSRYRRATLLSPEGERITVDADLRWTLPDGTTLVVPEIVIVETKSESGAAQPTVHCAALGTVRPPSPNTPQGWPR